ncbi:Glucose-induced degradation complex subunit [Pleodorina starrii]|uniref:Glucose-induced degradation complex subunit n=1 Tax=Pleodorina starrii TaxID=330485 RepID=A0A9W6BVN0_9CHLO|nr:Glucose-induced degradation complex subunit [Pleodorina starrii]GLC58341.1 Glucose-induced degradation complex subunit [Pleodorina starrii]GLC69432.1 Glucose-induced degradation complex subunit [Pleodorina starrii]
MGRGEAGSKKNIPLDVWEQKLAAVRVPKNDMNRLIMNFLVTEGYVEAARMFEKESGTAPGVDLDAITDRMEVRRALQGGDVEAAMERVNDLDPEILESQPKLFFHLQQQRLIELIRAGDVESALDFAQENLAPLAEENSEFLEELERTVALLAFEDTKSCPVGDLMEVAQRQKTASELNAAILQSQAQEREPRLPVLLKVLLWAQAQLDERATYPRITDLATAQLVPPTKAE